jgi:hypothetical protein
LDTIQPPPSGRASSNRCGACGSVTGQQAHLIEARVHLIPLVSVASRGSAADSYSRMKLVIGSLPSGTCGEKGFVHKAESKQLFRPSSLYKVT